MKIATNKLANLGFYFDRKSTFCQMASENRGHLITSSKKIHWPLYDQKVLSLFMYVSNMIMIKKGHY